MRTWNLLQNNSLSTQKKGFEGLYQAHAFCWNQIWQQSDIIIEGDLGAQ